MRAAMRRVASLQLWIFEQGYTYSVCAIRTKGERLALDMTG
jgi:hypothetical protein